ncbi:MAG: preprotein translocase subunit YajC [Actinomycetota bacterium]|jgi:preprotein translocase subunit YajC|nr:preprotein translocase subunit YajC [Actinomycetota bacterium]
MVGAIYLLLWRPQQRRIAAVRQLQSKIQAGDEVLTTSGIYGRITRLGEADAELEIAPGTVIHIARGAIGQRIEPESVPRAGEPHDGETGTD